MRAASEGHAEVVQLLLSAGANKEMADEVILIICYCRVLEMAPYYAMHC